MRGMSGDVDSGSTRPRPLSGGFWTLLSWLRGEEHSSSNESISSAGSDRTAVSFAFLAPAHYHGSAAPLRLPPPGPPTDTYKKRVLERNLRRQYDKDTTLHRKYGLFRGDGGVSFDVHSLPSARRSGNPSDKQERERRATSECFQRRAAHVPGKRRAPLPPTHSLINGTSSLNNRVLTRKRRAPQPPSQVLLKSKENFDCNSNKILFPMNPQTSQSTERLPSNGTSMGCKPEKYLKKELNVKDSKVKSEKGFLKQIFENRKRNSTDTPTNKILPNISELDKQAAEIIESSKLRKASQLNHENTQVSSKEEVWYCIKCSKRYNNSVDTCFLCKIKNRESFYSVIKDPIKKSTTIYTQTGKEFSNVSSLNNGKGMEDKQKLKEMLKEMKDSLPKRTKLNDFTNNCYQRNGNTSSGLHKKPELTLEAPTLRIGSNNNKDYQSAPEPTLPTQVTLNKISPIKIESSNAASSKSAPVKLENIAPKVGSTVSSENTILHTPLKISSLLNPIYIPKTNTLIQNELSKAAVPSPEEVMVQNSLQTSPADPVYVKTADAVRNILLHSSNSKPIALSHEIKNKPDKEANRKDSCGERNISNVNQVLSNNNKGQSSAIDQLNIHAKRRGLVNQLEKSIASGDERAAADAAIKLAQLRLSCSVLSFTSHILEQASTSNNTPIQNIPPKVISTTMSVNIVKPSTSKSIPENEDLKDKFKQLTPKEPVRSEVAVKVTVVKPNSIFEKTHAVIKNDTHVENANTKPEAFNQKCLKVDNSTQNIITKKTEAEGSQDKNKPLPKLDVATQSYGIKIVTSTEKVSQPSTSKAVSSINNDILTIAVWVEDKVKAHGPIDMKIRRQAVVGELRRQAEQSLGLPTRLQRWIVGRELCNDDDTTLVSLAGPNLDAPFYLCLVECDKMIEDRLRDFCKNKQGNTSTTNKISQNDAYDKSNNVYTELVKLESQAIVPNAEAFECEICMEHCATGDGVVLRECVHSFCRQCLVDVVRHSADPAVSCPAMGCLGLLHEREIRALVNPEEYARWLDRGLAAAESGTRNAFHCLTRDCAGWALCETGVRRFPCPVCKHTNCVLCQAIHEGETCEQYQVKLKKAANSNTNQRDEGTQSLIESLISRGEALQCPECSAVITKKWGCDWVKCSACKTEICWVTRGRRWGPGGRGDTSGGCRCGIDGKRCHPSCGYCH